MLEIIPETPIHKNDYTSSGVEFEAVPKFEGQLYLYESSGILSTETGLTTDVKKMLTNGILTPLLQAISTLLQVESRKSDDELYINHLRQLVMAIGAFSKGVRFAFIISLS